MFFADKFSVQRGFVYRLRDGDESHPVENLHAAAKKQFFDLLSRQSVTAADAVVEYRRRYGRNPPPEFNKWFAFAKKHASLIVDDYDEMMRSLEPFRKMAPSDVLRIMERANSTEQTRGYIKKCSVVQGKLKDCGAWAHVMSRSWSIEKVLQDLPNIIFIANYMDEPAVLAKHQTVEVSPVESDEKFMWSTIHHEPIWPQVWGVCDKISEHKQPETSLMTQSLLHFVGNVTPETDLCKHPEFKEIHGYLASAINSLHIDRAVPVLSRAVPYPFVFYAITIFLELASTATRFIVTANESEKERKILLSEIASIAGYCYVLKDLSERDEPDNCWSRNLRALLVKDGLIAQFRANLEEVLLILNEKHSKLIEKAKWPHQKNKLGEICSRIERQKSQILLALQSDHVNLSLDTKKDLSRVNDLVINIDRKIVQMDQKQQTQLQEKEKRDLETWLTSLNFCAKQNDIFARRQEGTGEWLLQDQNFQSWLTGFKRKLWCQGIPGSGKTILTSIMVNSLEEKFGDQNVDALDECSEEQKAKDLFLNEVLKLVPLDKPDLVIKATKEDVRRYLETRLEKELSNFVRKGSPLWAEIVDTVVRKSRGMFLLAQLHMDSLGREDTGKGVRKALQELPEQIDGTYEKAMARIKNQDSRKAERAAQVLSWICYAARPITVDELRYALAVEIGDTRVDEEAVPDGNHLVSLCAGLLTIDHDSNIIRFVHYTTQEYFERIKKERYPKAPTQIVMACITYLSFNEFATDPCDNDKAMEEKMLKYPFLQYASQYWGLHARGEPEKDPIVQELIMKFLWQNSNMSCSLQFAHIPKYKHANYSQSFRKEVSALGLAATNGLVEVTEKVLSIDADVNKADSDKGTPLHWAAWHGYDQIVKLILATEGVEIDVKYSSNSTPLHWAAEGGRASIVSMLLKSGAKINAVDVRKWTPLHKAAWHGHEAAVQVLLDYKPDVEAEEALLDNKADMESEDSDGGTALHAASERGHENVVKLLLKTGAKVNATDIDGGTALHRASWNGHLVVVQLLLDAKADVKARYSYGFREGSKSPSRDSSGEEVVVRLLMEKGAEVAAKYYQGGTALHWAAWSGHEEVVRLLLEKGADFTARDSLGETPLSAATKGVYDAMVAHLREKGVDVDQMVSKEEQQNLLSQTLKTDGTSTSLHWAVWGGTEEAVKPLLEEGGGININTPNQHGRTALHWASWSGKRNIVELLLGKGADISCQDNAQWTALHWAAWNGHVDVVKLLLDKGADATLKDLSGKTALDWAMAESHKEVIKALHGESKIAKKQSVT
ncbi:putative Ankyrin repeat domain-containing protein 50 [Glarea lozoyensis 74030]|uniref:Putative Ankyrin repeat domain-containing protein 50 n=1 Tax=Glarea lozoyensis (strain ATCC 74030 / MF5533) TaxID=1104152 RepID=H0EY23_GLAL7|nr:putative Ankyrin repeat domain-containing protein 50 [Glarea lozoyensis 74030]